MKTKDERSGRFSCPNRTNREILLITTAADCLLSEWIRLSTKPFSGIENDKK